MGWWTIFLHVASLWIQDVWGWLHVLCPFNGGVFFYFFNFMIILEVLWFFDIYGHTLNLYKYTQEIFLKIIIYCLKNAGLCFKTLGVSIAVSYSGMPEAFCSWICFYIWNFTYLLFWCNKDPSGVVAELSHDTDPIISYTMLDIPLRLASTSIACYLKNK